MDWVLPLHIGFVAIWLGSLVALPQLYAAHSAARDEETHERLVVLERSLFFAFMTPGAALTIVTGGWLLYSRGFDGGWLPVKLAFVGLLVLLHIYASRFSIAFEGGERPHRTWFFVLLAFAPVLIALPILFLVVAKPF